MAHAHTHTLINQILCLINKLLNLKGNYTVCTKQTPTHTHTTTLNVYDTHYTWYLRNTESTQDSFSNYNKLTGLFMLLLVFFFKRGGGSFTFKQVQVEA